MIFVSHLLNFIINFFTIQGNFNEKIEVGYRVPDFRLEQVEHFRDRVVTSGSLSENYFILNIWSLHCSHSVKTITNVDRLQKKFQSKLQFFLIGVDFDSLKGIRSVFEALTEKYKMQLPICYDNSKLNLFDVSAVPRFIWVDNKGIIQAITTDEFLNDENIGRFLEGKFLNLPSLQSQALRDSIQRNFSTSKPFLVKGNGGNDTNFIFRSILTNWDIATPPNPQSFLWPVEGTQLFMSAMDLKALYLTAYADTVATYPLHDDNNYGRFWPQPILETKDSSKFSGEFFTGKNMYAYSSIVPANLASRRNFQHILRNDLSSYFGYQVRFEKRRMPCWLVIASKPARKSLLTKNGPSSHALFQFLNYRIINRPVNDLIIAIWGQNQEKPPFIDETGITQNIDITIPGLITDFELVRAELKKQGILLIKSRRKMKVMIISDPDD